MPLGEALDDDYVASLLTRDAEDTRNRYVSAGLGPLLSRKPKGTASINTTFLRNLVRDTNSHNAALKAKEEEESKARLRNLKREQRGGKRRREDEREERPPEKRRRDGDRPNRWESALSGLGKRSDRRMRAKEETVEGEDSKAAQRISKDEDGSRHEHRRKRDREDRREGRGSYKPRPESLTEPKRRRTSSADANPHPKHNHRQRRSPDQDREDDSDPLDDLIGPVPPPKTKARGRGADSQNTMDARFKDPHYDPKADVNLEDDETDDWDMALEALRDRTKWRQQGAERLKAAGFTDDEVKKWETGKEEDVDALRWKKRGQAREWDSGKVLDKDGDVAVKADWVGRLKGN